MAETNLAEIVVEYLSSKNVRHIFGILAHTSFALGDAIAKRPHLRFINAQHEGGAGNIALGYARATKQPAVCLVSAGGGATNIVTAVSQAYKESVPLFVISSDIGTASSAKGAWSSWQARACGRAWFSVGLAVSSDNPRTAGAGFSLYPGRSSACESPGTAELCTDGRSRCACHGLPLG